VVGARGWVRIGHDARVANWAAAALPAAHRVLRDSSERWRAGGTWFVGVDALPNDAAGGIGSAAFPWDAFPLSPVPLHPAQLSVIRPGYPRRDPDETEAAARYRRTRDAAHLDGLLGEGTPPRRFVREPHGWILGLPLNDCSPDAAPLVVWEGSHLLMQTALRTALAPYPPAVWGNIDITDAYTAARARVFDTCARVELPVSPGQATLLHRLTIHGVAPWVEKAKAPREGRIIAYFRPVLASVAAWLQNP
jgi:hypothetical protein